MRRVMLTMTLLAWTVGACSADLVPITDAPPTKVADVDTFDDTLRISRGVALAVTCTDDCNGDCESPDIRSSNPNVLDVRPGYQTQGPTVNPRPETSPSVFVLIAHKVGNVTLTVESDCTEDDYEATVLP